MVKLKTWKLDTAPLCENLTPEALRCKGSHSFTCTPTNHAFAFSAEAGPHFTDPGGMEG